jgi:hypothetical protein
MTLAARRALRAFAVGCALQTAVVGLGCQGGTVRDSPVQSEADGIDTAEDDAAVPAQGNTDADDSAGADADEASDADAGDDATPTDGEGAGDGVPDDDDDADSEPIPECTRGLTRYEGTGSATMYWFDQGTVTPNCSHPILERGKGCGGVA